MIGDDVQKQVAGDGSTNIQSGTITIHQGISYKDVKEIALDIFNANFLKLSQNAAEIATKRAEELTENFLKKLQKEAPSSIKSMENPAMQMGLYAAQRAYAKTGDKDLGEILIQILVDRAQLEKRELEQIILEESLNIAEKLNSEQFDFITLVFIIRNIYIFNATNLNKLKSVLNIYITPFIDKLSNNKLCCSYISYTGCGNYLQFISYGSIEAQLLQTYPGLLCKGCDEKTVKSILEVPHKYTNFLMTSPHYGNMIQINSMNKDVIQKRCAEMGFSENDHRKIVKLFEMSLMSKDEVKNWLINNFPFMGLLIKNWDSSGMANFTLTPVGIAIARANIKRKTGFSCDLSVWPE